MINAVKNILPLSFLLFYFNGEALPADPRQDLKKASEQKGQKETKSNQPQQSPGGSIDLGGG
jgi:hypothetical protein